MGRASAEYRRVKDAAKDGETARKDHAGVSQEHRHEHHHGPRAGAQGCARETSLVRPGSRNNPRTVGLTADEKASKDLKELRDLLDVLDRTNRKESVSGSTVYTSPTKGGARLAAKTTLFRSSDSTLTNSGACGPSSPPVHPTVPPGASRQDPGA